MKGARSLTSEASSLFSKNGSFKSSNKKILSSVVPDFPADTVHLIPLGSVCLCADVPVPVCILEQKVILSLSNTMEIARKYFYLYVVTLASPPAYILKS